MMKIFIPLRRRVVAPIRLANAVTHGLASALSIGLSIVLPTVAHAAPADTRDLVFQTPCHQPEDVAVISVVGDILIHEAIYRHVVENEKNFTQIWRKAIPLFKKADFSIANLEGPAAQGLDVNGRDHGDVGFTYDNKIYSGKL